MPSSTRQRSLSFGAIPPRSVRPRPASTLPPTANIANSTAAILDALDAGHQAAPDALDDGAGLGTSPQGGTANAGPASPGSYAETQVGSEQSDAEDDAWAEAEHNQDAAAAAAAAAPVLKPGGKAQHCTLGTVSIIEIGPMGATIEFFSERANAVKERKVLLADLEPLPDETELRDDAGTPADVDNDDPLQARSPARRTRAAEPCAVHDAIPALFHAPKLHSAALPCI